MKRALAPLLSAALLLGAVYGGYRSYVHNSPGVTVLKGVIGSEKAEFFADPDVIAALERRGLRVTAETAGSRDIATRALIGYDFAFPSGSAAAQQTARIAGKKAQVTEVFYTPLAVATWKKLMPTLGRAGALKGETLNVARLLSLAQNGKRWRDLTGSPYRSARTVLVSTTDPRTSSSAAAFLGVAAFTQNREQVPDARNVPGLLPKLRPLFALQGYQDATSQGPFEDYLAIGMGKAPLVLVYEAQFITAGRAGRLSSGMRLVYPTPNTYTRHALVSLSDGGQRLAQAMTEPELQVLAAKHGWRTLDPKVFTAAMQSGNTNTSAKDTGDAVDLPAAPVLDALVQGVTGGTQ
ncbi:hypothetical protein [Deinococcus hopiensis]|uniref:Extracellular solute-binding protein n=1 Tax=Deinococcus hopiensis KR-140 TaxID=695939 RepID=A0A1W1UTQ5_9DEIO|nr:hypothetical protein [Deinococcus hopiensis]SMB84181.1 hypothetical protein SAMN00790413_05023 [Deinococcus hopiensis KR-140]